MSFSIVDFPRYSMSVYCFTGIYNNPDTQLKSDAQLGFREASSEWAMPLKESPVRLADVLPLEIGEFSVIKEQTQIPFFATRQEILERNEQVRIRVEQLKFDRIFRRSGNSDILGFIQGDRYLGKNDPVVVRPNDNFTFPPASSLKGGLGVYNYQGKDDPQGCFAPPACGDLRSFVEKPSPEQLLETLDLPRLYLKKENRPLFPSNPLTLMKCLWNFVKGILKIMFGK